MSGFPPWLSNISIWINHRTGGPPGYSLCARFWAGRLEGDPVLTVMSRVSNAVFWFDPGHCRNAWLKRQPRL